MSKKNFYAVKKGRKTGIFKSWDECSKSVIGYPKAKYKGFEIVEDAEMFLSDINDKIKEFSSDTYDDEKIYYVVRRGRKIGIFDSWEECKKQVHKFSNAEYKKVNGKVQALKYFKL